MKRVSGLGSPEYFYQLFTRMQTSLQPKGMGGKDPPPRKPHRPQDGSVLCTATAEETGTVLGVGARVPAWLPWLLEATEGHILQQKVAFQGTAGLSSARHSVATSIAAEAAAAIALRHWTAQPSDVATSPLAFCTALQVTLFSFPPRGFSMTMLNPQI